MATEQAIIEHTGRIEFLKEQARLIAGDMVEGADPLEITEDPDAFGRRILAAVLIAVAPLMDEAVDAARDYATVLGHGDAADGLDLEAIRDEAEQEFMRWALPAIAGAMVPIAANLKAQTAAGVSDAVIARAVTAEASKAALLAPLMAAVRSAAAAVVQDVERSVITAAADLMAAMVTDAGDEADGPPQFVWLTVGDDSVCEDEVENSCAPRHGMAAYMEQWDELGGPGAPNLLCSVYAKGGRSNCRCVLELAGDRERPAGPVDVAATIRDAKERARAAWATA